MHEFRPCDSMLVGIQACFVFFFKSSYNFVTQRVGSIDSRSCILQGILGKALLEFQLSQRNMLSWVP